MPDYGRPQVISINSESVDTMSPSTKDGTHMAISLTDHELATLDSFVAPVDANDDWIITDGGSAIRCDIEGMSEELAKAPVEHRSAQTLEVLRAYQADAIAARSK